MQYWLVSGSSVNSAIAQATFDFKHIQRTNEDIDLSVTITGSPTVVSYAWEVRNKSGVLKGCALDTASPSIPAITTTGFYDLKCWIKTATDQYIIEIEDAFYVMTPKFTEDEADLVIDLSDGNYYQDFASADNSDLKIYVKGSGTGYFAPLNLHGTSGHPVIIQKAIGNSTITQTGVSGSDGINIGGARYVIFDYYNDDGTRGYELVMPTGSLFGFRAENISGFTDLHVMGLYMNRTGASTDRAAFSFIPPVNATYNATNWIANNMAVYDCKSVGSGAENIYFNYTNDTAIGGYIPPKAKTVVIAWNELTDSGNDAIQWSSCIDARIHHNTIDTWGMQGDSSHENAFSWNEGNAHCRVFSNFAINGKMGLNHKTGLTPYDLYASETTPANSPNYFYNNIIVEGTPPAVGGTETFFNYLQTNGGSTATYPFHFFNNTIICNKKSAAIAFGSGGYRIPNLVWANNILVTDGTDAGDYDELDFTGSGTFPSSPTINNLVKTFGLTDDDILFVDLNGDSAADFQISSLSSPAYTGATNISSVVSGVTLIDHKGLPLNASGYAFGAYSGYGEKTITPSYNDSDAATITTPVSVGSITANGGTISFEANKEGLLYYTVVANGATAPTKAQVRSGSHGLVSGSILDGGTASTQAFTGLSESTAYDLYYVFVTKENVEEASVTKVDFTTIADSVAPTLSGWEITNAQPGRIYFNSSEPITATTYGGFTISGVLGTAPTVTGITINTGATTGHYLTVSANFVSADYLAKIAYSGSGSNLQDTASTPNALASFAATSITNSITYSKRIFVNITNYSVDLVNSDSWNDANFAGAGVQTIISDLDDDTNTPTGYAFGVANAFHSMQNAVNATAGTYINEAAALVRGFEVYKNGDDTGTFRFSGLTSGKAFDLIYLIKNTFGTGAGNVNVNGAGAVGYTTGTVERKVSGTVNGSGYVDFVITQTTSNTSECVVALALIVYP